MSGQVRTARRRDRALGALLGLALGDALGMPTQELTRERAEALLGPASRDRAPGSATGPRLIPAPADNPISAGLPAGRVTDDTEQALLLGHLLADGGGRVDARALADALLGWEERMAARGSLDLLGPTTRRALTAIRAGADPMTTGRGGRTNGAAMRITPVGIATPADPPTRLVAAVRDAGRPTHDDPVAHASAAAVATVVSLGIDGASFAAAWMIALDVATLAARTDGSAHADHADHADCDSWFADAVRRAVRIALAAEAAGGTEAALDAIVERVGTTLASEESVPAAFAVAALAPDDASTAAWLGARLGGDADTIAAIAGAMIGACTGAAALPADALATVRSVNDLDVEPLVDRLLLLRDAPA